MADIPSVKPEDWINVSNRDAVVCTVYKDPQGHQGRIEIVYLDRGRAINEDAYWNTGQWDFVSQNPCGGYADNLERLSRFVSILRGGRYDPTLGSRRKRKSM
jgi:hypothetical protein